MLTTTIVINTTTQPAEGWEDMGVKSISAASHTEATTIASQLGIQVLVVYAGRDIHRSFIILEGIRHLNIPTAVITTSVSEEIQISFLIRGATCIIPRTDSRALKAHKVKALVQGPRTSPQSKPLPEDLELDLAKAEARFKGKVLSLTRKQFDLLVILARNHNEFVHRQTIADTLKQEVSTGVRALDMMVSRTRAKLLSATSGALNIDSEYGLGYRLSSVATRP